MLRTRDQNACLFSMPDEAGWAEVSKHGTSRGSDDLHSKRAGTSDQREQWIGMQPGNRVFLPARAATRQACDHKPRSNPTQALTSSSTLQTGTPFRAGLLSLSPNAHVSFVARSQFPCHHWSARFH